MLENEMKIGEGEVLMDANKSKIGRGKELLMA